MNSWQQLKALLPRRIAVYLLRRSTFMLLVDSNALA